MEGLERAMTDMTDAVATRRALLAGALGAGALGAFAPGFAGEAAAPIPTNPSSAYFLKVTNIPGSSTDSRHAGWIDLLTFSWGASTSVNPLVSTSGSPASKSKPADFVFVARSSIASPKLFLACAKGTAITSVVLEVAKLGFDPFVYVKLTLQNVRVASFDEAPSEGDGAPLDVVHLRYAKVTHSFTPQKADGTPGSAVVATFDFATDTGA
jgi:type VI secretion system secreted protein Hcp